MISEIADYVSVHRSEIGYGLYKCPFSGEYGWLYGSLFIFLQGFVT